MVKITAGGKEITLLTNNTDYISLTDIARYKNPDEPSAVIANWLRGRDIIEFLGVWETMNNPDFNSVEFEGIKKQAGANAFTLSPKKWIEKTNAIGIVARSGRYGGAFAHSDIAFEFASWISPEFKLYIIQDYQRLKQEEAYKGQLDWKVNRYIAKINHSIHTDAIKENIIPKLTKKQISYAYASEMDLINVALYGMTAKEYQERYPEKNGNLRDNSSIEQLLILNNLQSFNAEMIKQGLPQHIRLEQLNKIASQQLKSLTKNNRKALQDLKKLIDK